MEATISASPADIARFVTDVAGNRVTRIRLVQPRAELEPLIGYVAHALPLRADLSGDPTFAASLRLDPDLSHDSPNLRPDWTACSSTRRRSAWAAPMPL